MYCYMISSSSQCVVVLRDLSFSRLLRYPQDKQEWWYSVFLILHHAVTQITLFMCNIILLNIRCIWVTSNIQWLTASDSSRLNFTSHWELTLINLVEPPILPLNIGSYYFTDYAVLQRMFPFRLRFTDFFCYTLLQRKFLTPVEINI